MGLSLDTYAAFTVSLTLILVVVCVVVSTLIVWRRSGDPMAMLVAFMLVTFGPVSATSTVRAISFPWQVPNACLFFLALSLLDLAYLGEFAIIADVQLYRYRRVSSPLERQQTKWVVYGLAVLCTVIVAGVVLLIVPALTSPSSLDPSLGLVVVGDFLLLLIPLSFQPCAKK
jgi:hypothetical protein